MGRLRLLGFEEIIVSDQYLVFPSKREFVKYLQELTACSFQCNFDSRLLEGCFVWKGLSFSDFSFL